MSDLNRIKVLEKENGYCPNLSFPVRGVTFHCDQKFAFWGRVGAPLESPSWNISSPTFCPSSVFSVGLLHQAWLFLPLKGMIA